MTVWTAVLLAGLASYLLRALPLLLLGRVELPPRVAVGLHHAAMGAMVAMLVTGAAHAAGALDAEEARGTVLALGRTIGVVAGVGVALVLGRRGRSMPVVVLSALVVYAAASSVAALVAAQA